jgi:pimeloyl-ACP methyl ester carboxylesterase
MAERMRLAQQVDFASDCSRILTPTQIVTGETELDRVVPVDSSREYLGAISGSQAVTIENTGHIGVATRPERFAQVVSDYARRTIGVNSRLKQVPA